jgi:nitrite reductase/ring-hydroxylating ferredoxin subunit
MAKNSNLARVIEQQDWLDPLGERLQQWLSTAIQQGGPSIRQAKDFLNGTWLGHPLHPALSDAPIGAWLTGMILDLVGEERGADAAVAFGVMAAVPTAASGLADWHDQSGKPRRVGLAHAFLNSAGLACFIGSLVARRSGDRSLGVGLSTAGLALATGGAYLGGDLVFAQGTSIDRNAWEAEPEDWRVAAKGSDLQDGQLAAGEIEVDGSKLPLVLLRTGAEVLALGAVCAHMGGPLAEGQLVDGRCVVCPWHGSTFDMRDGSIVSGPSAFPQPSYEARERNGNVEVRLRR